MRQCRGLFAAMIAGAAVLPTASCNENRETGAVTSRAEGPSSTRGSADKALVRFIHDAPNEREVDLYISGRDDPLFDGVDFESEAGWAEVDPMAGTLTVRPDNDRTALATAPDVKLEGGRSYTFVLAGRKGKLDLIRMEDGTHLSP